MALSRAFAKMLHLSMGLMLRPPSTTPSRVKRTPSSFMRSAFMEMMMSRISSPLTY